MQNSRRMSRAGLTAGVWRMATLVRVKLNRVHRAEFTAPEYDH